MDAGMALDIATTSAVVFGVIFGLAEVRQAVRDRRDLAAVDIVRTVQTQEVRQAVERVLRLPDDADPELVRGDSDTLDAALAVDSACEMWGSMVFEGVVDQHMLDRMVGGWIRGTWTRLRPWVEAERAEKRNPNIGECGNGYTSSLRRIRISGKRKAHTSPIEGGVGVNSTRNGVRQGPGARTKAPFRGFSESGGRI